VLEVMGLIVRCLVEVIGLTEACLVEVVGLLEGSLVDLLSQVDLLSRCLCLTVLCNSRVRP